MSGTRVRDVLDWGRSLLALCAIAAVFGTGWLLVGPRADVPVIDDWVYAWSVQRLVGTHRLEILPFSAIYPLAQIGWGALFAAAAGFSFVTLRISTLVLSTLGCWAVYFTLRELGCRRDSSLLGALALALDPVFFALSFSFMSDVVFVDVVAMALYFYVSSIQRDRMWRLWTAGAFSLAAYLVRPIGILLPLAAFPWLILRRGWRPAIRKSTLPIAVPVAAMVFLQWSLPRLLGPLDWAAIRQGYLRWVFSISFTTYAIWTIRVVVETVFPFAPLLLAPFVRLRYAVIAGVIALLLVVPMQRARGEILTPLPDWQTWSLQDIGARALIPGDAPSSRWSAYVTPVLRGAGLLVLASALFALVRGFFGRGRSPQAGEIGAAGGSAGGATRWSRGHLLLMTYGAGMLVATHALWLYNDRYYLVFAPVLAILSATSLEFDLRARSVAAALLALWAVIDVTGTRDLLAFNDAGARAARELEASGVPPWEIDAGYPLNGWRLYAHPENLPQGWDRRYDVPFVTSDRHARFTIVNHPAPGDRVVRVIPLPRATWQATHEIYVTERQDGK